MRKNSLIIILVMGLALGITLACKQAKEPAAPSAAPQEPRWADSFATDLSNAVFPAGVWTVSDGVLRHCGRSSAISPHEERGQEARRVEPHTITCEGT